MREDERDDALGSVNARWGPGWPARVLGGRGDERWQPAGGAGQRKALRGERWASAALRTVIWSRSSGDSDPSDLIPHPATSSGVQLQSPNITVNPSSNLSPWQLRLPRLSPVSCPHCQDLRANPPTAHSVPSLPSLALGTTDKEIYLRHSLEPCPLSQRPLLALPAGSAPPPGPHPTRPLDPVVLL